jgi:hypothetical protein
VSNYIKCSNSSYIANKHIKSIVNTAYVVKSRGDPHSFTYVKGSYAVNTDFKKVLGPFNANPTYTGWHINHYVVKVRNNSSLTILYLQPLTLCTRYSNVSFTGLHTRMSMRTICACLRVTTSFVLAVVFVYVAEP